MTNNGLNNGPASSGRPRTPPDLKAINAGWDGIPHATEVAAVLAAGERTNARQSTLKGLGEPPFEVPKIAGQVKVAAKPDFKRSAAWSVGTLTDVVEKARKNHAVKASIQSPLPPLMDEVYEGYKDGGEMSYGVVEEILRARKELRDALANNEEKKTVNVIAAAYKDFEDRGRDRMSAAPTVTTAPVEVDTLKVLPDIDHGPEAPEVDDADVISVELVRPVTTKVDFTLSPSTAPKLAAPDLTKDTAGRIPAKNVVRVNKLGFIIQHCKSALAHFSDRSNDEVSKVGYVDESESIRPGLMSRVESALFPRAGLYRMAVQQKSLDLLKARRKMEMDLDGLPYLALREVLETGSVQDWSDLDKWGDTPSEIEVVDFVYKALHESNSPLYAKVMAVHSRLIEARRKAYEDECAKIEADPSYRANIDSLVHGQVEIRDEHGIVVQAATGASWWLKAKEAVFGRGGNVKPVSSREAITIAPSTQSAAPNQLNVVTPSEEAATGAASSSVNAKRNKSRVIKALAGVLTVGAVLTGEKLNNSNNAEEDAMEPVATKVVPMENPIYERVHADNAPAPAEMKATKAPITGVPIISVGKKAEPVAKPAVRITPIINVGKAKQAPATTHVEEKKPAEEVAGPRLLTQADKDIALKKAMHNLASYKQRLTGLHKGDYKALTVEMKDLLLRRVDIINGILHTMRDDTDLEALNDVYKRMEEALTMLEKKRTAEIAPKYIASADVDVKLAIGRITNLKILLGAKTTKVTVKYKYHEVIDRHGRDSVAMYHPYTLDLAKMRADLEAIQRRVGPTGKYTPGSLHITEEQAKQDAVQAKYIADQLNWALWYARNGEKTMEYGEPVLMARNVKTSFSQTRK